KVRALLICREDVTALGVPATLLAKVRTVVIGTHADATTAAAEVVIPGLTVFEKNGTLINCQFRLQAFAQAVPGPAGVMPDALTIARLADADAAQVWKELSALPQLAGLDGTRLPAEGVPLDGSAWSSVRFPEGRLLKHAPSA
ncbi:MAG: molybdopterin-dependent oxidoreductase, partial [Opitutia bacterium]